MLETSQVVIATGGSGGLWRDTTNPLGSLGHGLAMAALAGAELADLEFVQFHPTAIDVGLDPMPLASEALRGDGAILVNDLGQRFMTSYARAELEPRDIVTRAAWSQISAGRRVFLDTRDAIGAAFPKRFPTINAKCLAAGIDPVLQPIPIRPAAHYHMGGIAVDLRGRTNVAGLWACGEAAATGFHGANRLASNSLLEAAISGQDVAADIAGHTATANRGNVKVDGILLEPRQDRLNDIRTIMTEKVGVLRDRRGLSEAMDKLLALTGGHLATSLPAVTALLIATSAFLRQESRGGHFRTDFPDTDPALAHRTIMTLDRAVSLARMHAKEIV